MGKLLKVLLSVVLACSAWAVLSASPAYAVIENCNHGYRTFNDHVVNGGVGQYGYANRCYWIDHTIVVCGYTSYAREVVDEWVSTTSGVGVTTSISIIETATWAHSNFDVHNTNLHGYTGQARFFYPHISTNTQIQDPSAQNWNFTQACVDDARHKVYGYSASTIKGIIAHEFGHAMGLSHKTRVAPAPATIMHPFDNRGVTRAQASDCYTINHLYG